jgi:hypothetical protein
VKDHCGRNEFDYEVAASSDKKNKNGEPVSLFAKAKRASKSILCFKFPKRQMTN